MKDSAYFYSVGFKANNRHDINFMHDAKLGVVAPYS